MFRALQPLQLFATTKESVSSTANTHNGQECHALTVLQKTKDTPTHYDGVDFNKVQITAGGLKRI